MPRHGFQKQVRLKTALAWTLLLASFGLAHGSSPKPVLHIDCSFTGTAGDLCEAAARAWAQTRKVDLRIERKILTSTEKLQRYRTLLDAASPDLDVFGLDVVWPGVFHKQLLDLEPFFRAELDRFVSVYVENNTVNGRLLAIPFSLGVGLLFYRKDLLEKHQMQVPVTWEELATTSKLIQEKERGPQQRDFWGLVFQGKAYEGLTCNALEWIAGHGGGTFLDPKSGRVLIRTANAIAALREAKNWIGTIAPPQVLTFGEPESHEYFRAGKATFLRAWPSAWAVVAGEASPLRGKVGVAVLPKGGAKGIHASALGGWSLAIARHTQHPELAVDLVKHLVSEAEQKKRALEAAGGPTLKKMYLDPEITAALPYYSLLMPVLNHVAARPSRITRAMYPQFSKTLWQGVHDILSKKVSEEEGASRLQNELEQLSKRWVR